jgi:2-C-methyl-D-erythritol 4-phosphate cytidylyltransferase
MDEIVIEKTITHKKTKNIKTPQGFNVNSPQSDWG